MEASVNTDMASGTSSTPPGARGEDFSVPDIPTDECGLSERAASTTPSGQSPRFATTCTESGPSRSVRNDMAP